MKNSPQNCVSSLIFVFLLILSTHTYSQDTPWKNIGPYMGFVNCMEMDMKHPDTLYAGTPTGMFKTIDGAENWNKSGLDGIDINSIQIAPTNSSIIIANSDSSVYKSDNYGETWSKIWQIERSVGAIALNPEDASIIWVGINVPQHKVYSPNLYRSNDGGENWYSVHFPKYVDAFGVEGDELKLSTVNSLIIDPSDTSRIYVGGKNDSYHSSVGCIFVSNNSGNDWTIKRIVTCSGQEVKALICTPAGYVNHRICAIVDDCRTNHQFFLSSDFGLTWKEYVVPSTYNLIYYPLTSGLNNAIEINPNFPEWIYIGAKIENASLAAFNIEEETWYYLPGSPLSYPTSILINPKIKNFDNSNLYISFNQNGVYKSVNNGDSWSEKNRGFSDVKVHDLVIYPEDPDKILVAITGNLAKTNNGGNSWTIASSSIGKLALNNQDTSIIFAGGGSRRYRAIIDYFRYNKSLDGGSTWTYEDLFRTQGIWDYYYTMWIGDILIFPDNPHKILIGVDGGGQSGEGLYRSTNGGDSWSHKYTTGVSTIAMDPTNNDVIYLGTTNKGYVSRSGNGGYNWTRISPGGNDAFVSSVRDLDVDKNNQVFATTSSGLFKWEGNEDWSLVQGFPTTSTSTIVIDNHPATPVYYVGTNGQGVFESKDLGDTWHLFNQSDSELKSINTSFENLSISKLVINDSYPRYLYAGTENRGVWITMLKKNSTSISEINHSDLSFLIYPNPNDGNFNLMINSNSVYDLTLKVINSVGQIVAERFIKSAGINKTESFDISQLNKGIYLLNISTNKYQVCKKIVVQ
ncbi:MAG: T9SS type A sorting domain-containing protein [Bacteroidetes bacterium]|nr:T9SS type A sorting domain-containing protein [Bacteroidota bacterium]